MVYFSLLVHGQRGLCVFGLEEDLVPVPRTLGKLTPYRAQEVSPLGESFGLEEGEGVSLFPSPSRAGDVC